MSLQELAWVAAGLSLTVATATFVINVIDRSRKDRREEILKWQRTIVYSIIQDGHTTFDEIKTRYLGAAQQSEDVKVPKTEIQDGALQLVLLSLLEAKLISMSADGEYLLNVVEPASVRQIEQQFKETAFKMYASQQTERRAVSRIYEIVESQPGVYTIDSLHRYLGERQFEIDYDALNLAVRGLLARRELFMGSNNKLYAHPPAQPSPRPSSQPASGQSKP